MKNEPIIIDAMGLRCPMPVQKLKNMIKNIENWTRIHLIVDDPEALHDIPALIKRMNLIEPVIEKNNMSWILTIKNKLK